MAAVLCEDGSISRRSDLTPQQLLTKYGTGVYTTALVTPDGCIVDWELHQQRLLRGIEIVNKRPSKPFDGLISALNSESSSLAAFSKRRIVPAIKAALTAYYEDRDAAHPQAQPEALPHAFLVVSVAPRSGAPGSSSPPPAEGGNPSPDPGAPCASPSSTNSALVAVYVKDVRPPPYGPEHAVQAAVLGRPRSLAGAKASSWVEERRAYEQAKPPAAAEVLLADAQGRLLEGLTTNFFALCPPDPATGRPATVHTYRRLPRPRSPRPVVPAAPGPTAASPPALVGAVQAAGEAAEAAEEAGGLEMEEEEGGEEGGKEEEALPGVVQARVLEAAAALGMAVVAEAPRAGEREGWSEAFITNCIKRIQPLSRVFCPRGNAWGVEPWDRPLPHPAGALTTALRERLGALEVRTHWSEL
ncbi:hypothetical protein HYH03_000355 [Edaphochlamys debaryana]|uniref:Uncharacterized protein n=1 Tax=Edaphochlamys debaryana TaxID=47281 RepID=A0A835YFB3_9CHLO|nr:hypothetical protein HYH03_000355 [Edaphochlamys debaryana]|eukprot:KAG2501857.1 hypothetical protein HYH03_000355 [Edaphochlamys debaryana]